MGLDTSHGCWSGAYSAFSRWRSVVAHVGCGIDLNIMEGFNDAPNAIPWESLKLDILHVLLNHSDCDGVIRAEDCAPLADRLTELLPLLPEGGGGGHIGDWREKTQRFIDGLRYAASLNEDVEFH